MMVEMETEEGSEKGRKISMLEVIMELRSQGVEMFGGTAQCSVSRPFDLLWVRCEDVPVGPDLPLLLSLNLSLSLSLSFILSLSLSLSLPLPLYQVAAHTTVPCCKMRWLRLRPVKGDAVCAPLWLVYAFEFSGRDTGATGYRRLARYG
jgi:hypothetical protein